MNGAPDWQDGECCFRCRTQFTLVARKHHCRNCGNIFCAKCSSQQIPLPKLNIEKNVRVCDTCYEKISSKSDDPLTMALSSRDKEPAATKPKTTNSKASSSSGNKQTSNNASAPSEQELKEEEEFQLALALSLSETPTKVTFPDYRNFEEANNHTTAPVQTSKLSTSSSSTVNSNNALQSTTNTNTSNGINQQRANIQQEVTVPPVNGVDQYPALSSSSMSVMPQPQQQIQQIAQAVQPQQPEYRIEDRDIEVFKYVNEVQSTLEIYNNRLESCKLRNRPVANDAAIQSLFLKLNTEFQPKLAEYVKTYEDERADLERLQDKLSQIADARAALDALREEHQEKVRQQAAEAERQRQSQLATKLEVMRQNKSQMMQYQRELALRRIREQEQMMLHQQPVTTQGYQVPPVTGPQHMMSGQQTFDPMHDPLHSAVVQHPPTTVHQEWQQPSNQLPTNQHYTPVSQASYAPAQQQHYQNSHTALQPPTITQVSHQSHLQQLPHVPLPQPQPAIDRVSLAQLERQFLPNAKPEEDTPLISFDD